MSRDITKDVVHFVQEELGSVWALKMMLILRAEPERRWSLEALVRELRASRPLIAELLDRFEKTGLAKRGEAGGWHWHLARSDLKAVTDRIAADYAVRPVSVIQMIAQARQESY